MVEGNFDRYRMLRLADIPRISIHTDALSGHERYANVGEAGVGVIGPAIANAVFAANGVRLRKMPFRPVSDVGFFFAPNVLMTSLPLPLGWQRNGSLVDRSDDQRLYIRMLQPAGRLHRDEAD